MSLRDCATGVAFANTFNSSSSTCTGSEVNRKPRKMIASPSRAGFSGFKIAFRTAIPRVTASLSPGLR